ncbi:MAG: hypothetical protein MUQ75_04495, partial [Crocinitomicaceae bacterium]|nr:hypothetical protein [Crocinitomicaceae bacterium]
MKNLLFLFYTVAVSSTILSQEIIVKDTSSIHINEAIVILPGFGDTKKGRKNQKSFFQHKGYDLYIPKYKDSKSLDN